MRNPQTPNPSISKLKVCTSKKPGRHQNCTHANPAYSNNALCPRGKLHEVFFIIRPRHLQSHNRDFSCPWAAPHVQYSKVYRALARSRPVVCESQKPKRPAIHEIQTRSHMACEMQKATIITSRIPHPRHRHPGIPAQGGCSALAAHPIKVLWLVFAGTGGHENADDT